MPLYEVPITSQWVVTKQDLYVHGKDPMVLKEREVLYQKGSFEVYKQTGKRIPSGTELELVKYLISSDEKYARVIARAHVPRGSWWMFTPFYDEQEIDVTELLPLPQVQLKPEHMREWAEQTPLRYNGKYIGILAVD